MSMNNQGRATRSETGQAAAEIPATFTGNRALMLEESLVFESGFARAVSVSICRTPPK